MVFFKRKQLTPSQQEFIDAKRRARLRNIGEARAEKLQRLRKQRISEEGKLRIQQKGESEISKLKMAKQRLKMIKEAQFQRSFAGQVIRGGKRLTKAARSQTRTLSRPIPKRFRARERAFRKRPAPLSTIPKRFRARERAFRRKPTAASFRKLTRPKRRRKPQRSGLFFE